MTTWRRSGGYSCTFLSDIPARTNPIVTNGAVLVPPARAPSPTACGHRPITRIRLKVCQRPRRQPPHSYRVRTHSYGHIKYRII
eukprot:1175609-Prorocentrum_minimum.AAC.2